jgi:tartronate-semialdehyde synthase
VTELRSTLLRKTDFDNVPVKPQRVYREVNDVFDEDTVFLTAIGLYQIFSGQFQKTYKPRHYICCGQAGPLGWEVPACIGAKLGAPEKLIVGIVGDYSFQFLMEEVAVAVQYRVPFVLVMLNNTYMGLIRQAEKYGYDDLNYAVDLSYEAGETVGIDHVGVMEAMGALGRRVTEPGDIADTLRWAVDASEEHQLPVLVEIMTERDTDAAMGVAIDAINEYEPVLDGVYERPGAVVGALPERD